MNDINDIVSFTPSLLAYIVVCVVLLLGSYWILDLLTPGKLTAIIKGGGWNAAIVASAQLIAVALIIMFSMISQPVTFGGIVTATVFSAVGVAFQLLSTWIIRLIWLRGTDVEALLHDRVTPSGLFLASSSLAVGMVMAVAVY